MKKQSLVNVDIIIPKSNVLKKLSHDGNLQDPKLLK